MEEDKDTCRTGAQEVRNVDPAFVEQYKLYVESADNVSARRVTVNRYQTTLNSGIIAFYGITITNDYPQVFSILVALVGVFVSWNWLATIRSLKRLNEAKFEILHSMEETLPRSIYKEEEKIYEANSEKSSRIGKLSRYKGATEFEQRIPGIFVLVHIAMIVLSFYWL